MDASVDVEHYVQAARQTSLKPWLDRLGIELSSEQTEAAFREAWAATVAEAARWPPPAWTSAVAWLQWLPWLPAIAHVGAGGGPLAWLRTDMPGTGASPGGLRVPEALVDAGPSPESAWLEQWRQRLPDTGSWSEDLVALAEAHREAMANAALPGPTLRLAFAEALKRRFRRYAGGPGALFAWLLLAGADGERLRYGLLRLRLVPEISGAASWA
jgi:hypothetical protein